MAASDVESSPLPPLYAPWIDELLGSSPPEEGHATCSTCAMCPPTSEQAATGSLVVFHPGTKCCTYVPTLPNFLVGMVLNDRDALIPAGRATVEERIGRGVGVTPLGLQADPHYALIYKHAGGELFGRTPGLRCPHLLPTAGGLCGVWRYRNAVCTTWFCKHERGRTAQRFWEALRQLLTLAERHLALWAAAQLGEALEGLGTSLLPYYATPLPAPEIRWSGRWADAPEEFYRAAARLVEPLSWKQVGEIGGAELALLAQRLRAVHQELQGSSVPDYLRFASTGGISRSNGSRALLGYSKLDLPIIQPTVADALPRFDGQHSTADVCRARDGAPAIDAATVRHLVDFEILVPALPPRPSS